MIDHLDKWRRVLVAFPREFPPSEKSGVQEMLDKIQEAHEYLKKLRDDESTLAGLADLVVRYTEENLAVLGLGYQPGKNLDLPEGAGLLESLEKIQVCKSYVKELVDLTRPSRAVEAIKDQHVLIIGDQRFQFRPSKVFDLLCCLIQSKSQRIDHYDLWDQVWGQDWSDTSAHLIIVTMNQARAKMKTIGLDQITIKSENRFCVWEWNQQA